jgi:hypothetical protein
MAAIPRSLDDIIIDNMVLALQAFNTLQLAENPDVGFNVTRDLVRMPSMRDMPLSNIWLESLDPQPGGSTSRTVQTELARINVDCYAKGVEMKDDARCDDGAAMERLYYFKEQVKYGLYKLINADFGMAAGTIGRKRWPNWRLFQTDLKLPETEVVAGRWVVELEYSWNPEDITGTELDRITVDAGRWSALYTY